MHDGFVLTNRTFHLNLTTMGLLSLDGDGNVKLRHSKTHLWGDWERTHFQPGDVLPPICDLGSFRVASVICYEVEFAEMIRYLGKQKVDLVLVPTAVASDAAGLRVLTDRLLPTRAVENNLWVVYANRCGTEG